MGADRSDRNGLSMGVGIGEYVCIRVWIRVTGDIASYCFKLDMCAQQESGSLVKPDFVSAPLAALRDLPTPNCTRKASVGTRSPLYHWGVDSPCRVLGGWLADDPSLSIRWVERSLVVYNRIDQQQELACGRTACHFARLARRAQPLVERFDDWIEACGIDRGAI
jgi:hypothetical protein